MVRVSAKSEEIARLKARIAQLETVLCSDTVCLPVAAVHSVLRDSFRRDIDRWSSNGTLIQFAGHLRGRALQEWGLLPSASKLSLKKP